MPNAREDNGDLSSLLKLNEKKTPYEIDKPSKPSTGAVDERIQENSTSGMYALLVEGFSDFLNEPPRKSGIRCWMSFKPIACT